ncbi:helix-turn-helix domain-containing protein [Bradyrhizobium sp. 180]|uniref:helix-turn-helix domain-containing protein n=1 Tax=Bradyrhizobium sp. 180 TaxID=2782650 RepID=UPI001FF7043A|nr:helix-turn-helix domain-containing protein [Bradyrhizobium sp. 180]MCK1493464.1 helix-turn-helix domain-containing protein [Bradyrhizobium sp. 180]
MRKLTPEGQDNRRLVYDLWPEAGQMLGLTKNGAYAAAKRGEIPTIRIGRLLKVPKAAFDKMLEEAGAR